MSNSVLNLIGNTPLVDVSFNSNNTILAKLEGNNPGGSVKDRAALRMIEDAEKSGQIKKNDTLIEATSGNTGIALAMVAAMKGYKMRLIMPETASIERVQTMRAYGADVILVSKDEDMEGARDLATLQGPIGPDAFPKETIIPLNFKHSMEPSNVFFPTPS